MKPCDCKSNNDVKTLPEAGLTFNNWSIEIQPFIVKLENTTSIIKIPMTTFKILAIWYLDQNKLLNHSGRIIHGWMLNVFKDKVIIKHQNGEMEIRIPLFHRFCEWYLTENNPITFDIDIALRDEGNCKNQKIECIDCPIGKQLEYPKHRQMCKHEVVYGAAKIIKEFL